MATTCPFRPGLLAIVLALGLVVGATGPVRAEGAGGDPLGALEEALNNELPAAVERRVWGAVDAAVAHPGDPLPPAVAGLYWSPGSGARNGDIEDTWRQWGEGRVGHMGWGVYPNRLEPNGHRSLWKFVALGQGRKVAVNVDFTLPGAKALVAEPVSALARRFHVHMRWYPARPYWSDDAVVTEGMLPGLAYEGFSGGVVDRDTLLHGGTLRRGDRFAIVAIGKSLFQTYLATGSLTTLARVEAPIALAPL